MQLDTCQIAPGFIQYTAVDDCTRYRVLRVFPRRTAVYKFLSKLSLQKCIFHSTNSNGPRQGIFAFKVQEMLRKYGTKFRSDKPAYPHLNEKVERSQKTDKIEFCATIDFACNNPDGLLAEWQHCYNRERPHRSLPGKTLMERCFELAGETPFSDEVSDLYGSAKERIQEQNYALDFAMRKLKPSR